MSEIALPSPSLRGRALTALARGFRFYTNRMPFRRGAGLFTRPMKRFLRQGWPAPTVSVGHGLIMQLEPSNVGFTCLEKGTWEPEQTALIESLLEPGSVILNVGANTGYYVLTMAALAGPDGHVHAFEIQPRMIDLLRHNVALNHLQERVTITEKGCFSSEGEATIAFHSDPGSTRIAFEPVGTRVTLTTIDQYVAESGLDRLDFILIDTEGADLEVLRGGQDTIRRFQPVVMAEAHLLAAFEGSEAEMIELMTGLGYRAEEIQNDHSKDFLFRPNDG